MQSNQNHKKSYDWENVNIQSKRNSEKFWASRKFWKSIENLEKKLQQSCKKTVIYKKIDI